MVHKKCGGLHAAVVPYSLQVSEQKFLCTVCNSRYCSSPLKPTHYYYWIEYSAYLNIQKVKTWNIGYGLSCCDGLHIKYSSLQTTATIVQLKQQLKLDIGKRWAFSTNTGQHRSVTGWGGAVMCLVHFPGSEQKQIMVLWIIHAVGAQSI